MHYREVEDLRQWFYYWRALPWRENATPYAVWISEIMLQQTRAEVVIPHYRQWLKLFPDVNSLASAAPDAVIKAWEGLGYYSRARKAHETAKILMRDHRGVLPSDESGLLRLGGIGPYTAAAIAAFAFGKKAAPLDGNAMRVLTRWSAWEGDITELKTQKELRGQFLKLLPDYRPWEIAEAVIELGALVCKKQRPSCSICPLRGSCRARLADQIDRYPVRKNRVQSQVLVRLALLIRQAGAASPRYLVRKNLSEGVMRDLWEFPYLELEGQSAQNLLQCPSQIPLNQLISTLKGEFEIPGADVWTPLVRHTFTRYRVFLRGLRLVAKDLQNAAGEDKRWEVRFLGLDELRALPFSSGHRRLMAHLAL